MWAVSGKSVAFAIVCPKALKAHKSQISIYFEKDQVSEGSCIFVISVMFRVCVGLSESLRHFKQ